MKEKEIRDAGTTYPAPVPSSPGRPGKSKQQEDAEEEDPLFDEDVPEENFEEDEEDEYEINDKVSVDNLADIYDYMSASL
ncbi:MAG: hypothetical protein JWO09_2211 [Bacteroidetes bacterium]|nr:hypothetical protein [Bacteroidota bacterium]